MTKNKSLISDMIVEKMRIENKGDTAVLFKGMEKLLKYEHPALKWYICHANVAEGNPNTMNLLYYAITRYTTVSAFRIVPGSIKSNDRKLLEEFIKIPIQLTPITESMVAHLKDSKLTLECRVKNTAPLTLVTSENIKADGGDISGLPFCAYFYLDSAVPMREVTMKLEIVTGKPEDDMRLFGGRVYNATTIPTLKGDEDPAVATHRARYLKYNKGYNFSFCSYDKPEIIITSGVKGMIDIVANLVDIIEEKSYTSKIVKGSTITLREGFHTKGLILPVPTVLSNWMCEHVNTYNLDVTFRAGHSHDQNYKNSDLVLVWKEKIDPDTLLIIAAKKLIDLLNRFLKF